MNGSGRGAVGHRRRRTSASWIARQNDLWRSWVDSGQTVDLLQWQHWPYVRSRADSQLSASTSQNQPVRTAPILAVQTNGAVSPQRSFVGTVDDCIGCQCGPSAARWTGMLTTKSATGWSNGTVSHASRLPSVAKAV